MKKWLLLFGIIILGSLIIWSIIGSKAKVAPPVVEQDYQYSAWVPSWAKEDEILTSLKNSKNKLKTLLPSWYLLTENGSIISQAPTYEDKVVWLAREQNLQILPTIENDFDPIRVSKLLSNRETQEKLTGDLIKIAAEKDYIGWDLNWEQIDQKDRQSFSEFVAFLKQEFGKFDLVLSVTVHARTGTSIDWEKSLGHDYQVLGSSADFIRVMAYDFNHPKSSPGPVTPPENLRAVLQYVQKNIPAEKIILGLPTYGYDWGDNGADGLQYGQMIEVLSKNNGQWQKDNKNLALNGTYTVDNVLHQTWFENADTIAEKIKIAGNEFQISSFCFWRLGSEDPAIWESK